MVPPSEVWRTRRRSIQRSAWKSNSRKFTSGIMHRAGPMRHDFLCTKQGASRRAVHKTPIIPLGDVLWAPLGVGPPERGYMLTSILSFSPFLEAKQINDI